MSQDGSAGRDLIQVGRDYVRHVNVNIASGNWLTAGVSLLPAIVALGLVGTGVKFTVEHVVSTITHSAPIVISPSPNSEDANSQKVNPPGNKSQSVNKVSERKLGSNEDIFHATPIALKKTIFDSIINAEDQDFFSFVTPGTYRDMIQVRIENSSTTLRPSLMVYDAEKRDISGWQYARNSGANLEYSFVAQPNSTYYLHMSKSGRTSGDYKLTITPLKRYDKYEPNKDLFNPKSIAFGRSISAGIMDSGDQDFYQFKTPSNTDKVVVSIQNRSTTLRPSLIIYDAEKRDISGWQYARNSGANLEYSFVAQPNSTYYLHVSKSGRTSGDYTLTVKASDQKS